MTNTIVIPKTTTIIDQIRITSVTTNPGITIGIGIMKEMETRTGVGLMIEKEARIGVRLMTEKEAGIGIGFMTVKEARIRTRLTKERVAKIGQR